MKAITWIFSPCDEDKQNYKMARDLEVIFKVIKIWSIKKLFFTIIFQVMIAIAWLSELKCWKAKLQNGCLWPWGHFKVTKIWYVQETSIQNNIPRYDSDHMDILMSIVQTSQTAKWLLVTSRSTRGHQNFDTSKWFCLQIIFQDMIAIT